MAIFIVFGPIEISAFPCGRISVRSAEQEEQEEIKASLLTPVTRDGAGTRMVLVMERLGFKFNEAVWKFNVSRGDTLIEVRALNIDLQLSGHNHSHFLEDNQKEIENATFAFRIFQIE